MAQRFSRATLSVFSETHRAADVGGVLGLEAELSVEKGERRTGRNGLEYRPHQQSGWHYSPDYSRLDPDDDSGFAALRLLLDDLHGKADLVASLRPRYLTAIRWSGDTGSTQGNFTMSADLLVDLGALGCEFWGTVWDDMSEGDA